MTDATLDLITLNTWKNEGAFPYRTRIIESELRALEPDIVLLQEVFALSGEPCWAEGMAARLGWYCRHAPARRKWRTGGVSGDSTSGLAILSRREPEACGTGGLPSSEAGGERIYQWARFRTAGGRCTCVNLHLCHLRDGAAERAAQWRAVRPVIEAGRERGPVLVGGDFNEALGEDGADPTAHALALPFAEPARDLGMTLPTTGARAHPPFSRGRQIDRILLFRARTGGTAGLRPTGVDRVMDRPDPSSGRLPSDHAGVRLRMEWSPATRAVDAAFKPS